MNYQLFMYEHSIFTGKVQGALKGLLDSLNIMASSAAR